ncbi:chemotaxis protein CheX [Phenylobacterium deserti]|uniref:Chemotaxis protein CheX n=1 Tax=Phenylobacterium deserti TaxID=1914756 RepID=A0A328ATE4_9CAUL|nr:chemotaxis protein CheX [Phenylobacterium deserti]RAK57545.1 chemotaxis protein CheX [Phenylobacterium deserti]
MSGSSGFLDELEVDALTELVNIGVSRAASSLRQMVQRQVFLSVPSIEVISRRDAATLMAEREIGPLVAVRQEFTGAFAGRALLIFPEANSLALVRAVTGDELSEAEAADLEDEALAETGNVVLNNCLATMANMLQRPLEMSLPGVMRDPGPALFEIDAGEDDGVVLFLYINFAVTERDIRGYIAILMDLPSLDALKTLVGEFIQRVLGQGAAAEA